ncbi:hypothetical protein BH09BAC4_BH09BAC4_01600 [soil metagenome]
MKQGRFTETQIVAILKQQDSGQTVTQITREHGISEATARTAPLSRKLLTSPGTDFQGLRKGWRIIFVIFLPPLNP